MTRINDERARAEQIAVNARHIEIAILRLIRRLDASEVVACGLEDSRKLFAGLATRYGAAARGEPLAAADSAHAGGWRLAKRQSAIGHSEETERRKRADPARPGAQAIDVRDQQPTALTPELAAILSARIPAAGCT